MPRSSRSFALATKASVDEHLAEYPPLEIPFTDLDAEPVKTGNKKGQPKERIVVANFPGDGLMFSMASSMSSDDRESNPASGVKKFLRGALSHQDFLFVWGEVEKNRLSIEDDVMGMIAEMMELWTGFSSQQ
jgi:hypothetical protein